MTGTCKLCGQIVTVPDVLGGRDEENMRQIGMKFADHVRQRHADIAQKAAFCGQNAAPLLEGYTLMRQMQCSDARFAKGLGLCRTAVVELLETAGVFEDEDAEVERKKKQPNPVASGSAVVYDVDDTQELPSFPDLVIHSKQ